MKARIELICRYIFRIFAPIYYFFVILNKYAWGEELGKSERVIAPFCLWGRRLLLPLFGSFVFYLLGSFFLSDFDSNLSRMIENAYPSILGFAIGLYAIVFSSEKFEMLNDDVETRGKAFLISVDMAFPLMVMLTAFIINYLVVSGDGAGLWYFGVFNVYSFFVLYDMLAAVYSGSLRRRKKR
ncbi:hypothetical protein KUW18_16565 [Halomonas sp. DP5Y7-2]|uniref:hypothetical protein n=1 Tax=Halomonas sp. DP5Y7-2 TaxID=2859076 RepID=UPI001C99741D|nr:hypothetical protein [Halomonas sp. DP5Y7-2]MBY5985707.1 hypothetical protein [Halomonas sp. DP5Y7-2]